MIPFPEGSYRCIVVDPPWPQQSTGAWRRRHARRRSLPYETITLAEIRALPVETLAGPAAHLWLWTTNAHLRDAFALMQAWGFTYLNMVTWVKPSGLGAWFANTTQHCLFGYYRTCVFPMARYRHTHFHASTRPGQHSRKPDAFYDLVRSISPGPRIDLFNRRHIEGFEGWGDEAPTEYQPEMLLEASG